jgi:hypothetical protein
MDRIARVLFSTEARDFFYLTASRPVLMPTQLTQGLPSLGWDMNLTTHLHTMSRSRILTLYLHFTLLHVLVLN